MTRIILAALLLAAATLPAVAADPVAPPAVRGGPPFHAPPAQLPAKAAPPSPRAVSPAAGAGGIERAQQQAAEAALRAERDNGLDAVVDAARKIAACTMQVKSLEARIAALERQLAAAAPALPSTPAMPAKPGGAAP